MQDEKSHTLYARHLNVSPGQSLLVKVGKDEFRHKVGESATSVQIEIINEGVSKPRDPSRTIDNPATDGMKVRANNL